MCSMHGVLPICSLIIVDTILFLYSYQSNWKELYLYIFFLPTIFNKVPLTPSHTFFSTCITSILCFNFNFNQYSNLNKVHFFVQFNSSSTCFCFLSTLFACLLGLSCLRQPNCHNISSLENTLGGGQNLGLQSCCQLLHHPWSRGKKHWWPM